MPSVEKANLLALCASASPLTTHTETTMGRHNWNLAIPILRRGYIHLVDVLNSSALDCFRKLTSFPPACMPNTRGSVAFGILLNLPLWSKHYGGMLSVLDAHGITMEKRGPRMHLRILHEAILQEGILPSSSVMASVSSVSSPVSGAATSGTDACISSRPPFSPALHEMLPPRGFEPSHHNQVVIDNLVLSATRIWERGGGNALDLSPFPSGCEATPLMVVWTTAAAQFQGSINPKVVKRTLGAEAPSKKRKRSAPGRTSRL